jgi:hypothetical protein
MKSAPPPMGVPGQKQTGTIVGFAISRLNEEGDAGFGLGGNLHKEAGD